MPSWSKDADTISISTNWDELPIFRNHQLEEFIKSPNKLFVVAPKGLGKTLQLKAKSNYYRSENKAHFFYPVSELCEKIGTGVDAKNLSLVIQFDEIQQWEIIWDISLSIVILKIAGISIPDEITALIGEAKSVSDIASVLLNERGAIYKLQLFLPRFLRPGVSSVTDSIVLFIDNIDEAFIDNEIVNEQNKEFKKKLALVWRNAQLAFIQSAKRITQLNSQVKVFSTIRSEAVASSFSSTDLQTQEYCSVISYSKNELREIFREHIKKSDKKFLMLPDESDEFVSFFGFKSFPHVCVIDKEEKPVQEDAFDYILRHTLGRPRELIEIGNKISRLNLNNPSRGTTEFRQVVNENSSALLNQYKREVIPFFDYDSYHLINCYAKTNVLTKKDIQLIIDQTDIDPNDFWNTIEYFYKLGLIGFVENNNEGNLVQKFLPVSEYINSADNCLPDTNYYLMHPSLEEDLKHGNSSFLHIKYSIIGDGYAFYEQSINNSHSCNAHFGAGRLGLGLVVPIFQKLGKVIILQRCSEKWQDVKEGDYELNIKGIPSGHYKVITESTHKEQIKQLLSSNENLLAITSDKDVIALCLAQATSVSTALSEGLDSIVDNLESIDKGKKICIYPFENDLEMVKKFESKVKSKFENIDVVYVTPDKICTDVCVSENTITVSAEEYSDVVIHCLNDNVKNLLEPKPNNIRLAFSAEEFMFFYEKKVWLVNGIHMILAIYAYGKLLEKQIPIEDWERYSLNLFSDFEDIKYACEIFSIIQILRLFLVHKKIIPSIFPSKTQKEIFDQLLKYSKDVLVRISNSPDLIKRVLDLKKNKKLQKKYENSIRAIKSFVTSRTSDIEQLMEDIGPISNEIFEPRKIMEIKILNIDQQVIDLLDHTSSLFLALRTK